MFRQSQPALSRETLDKVLNQFYPIWLTRSFEEQTSCWIMDGDFYLNQADIITRIPLEDQQQSFRNKIREMQEEERIPLPRREQM